MVQWCNGMAYFQPKPRLHNLSAIGSHCHVIQIQTLLLNLTEPLERTKNNHWKQKHGHRTQTLFPLHTANPSRLSGSLPLCNTLWQKWLSVRWISWQKASSSGAESRIAAISALNIYLLFIYSTRYQPWAVIFIDILLKLTFFSYILCPHKENKKVHSQQLA